MSYGYRDAYPPMPKKAPMPRKDPFRTLDDPAPVPPPGHPLAPGPIEGEPAAVSVPQWLVLGHLRVPLKRPNWARRFVVWLLLGWRFDV